jgi:hypothetical protein
MSSFTWAEKAEEMSKAIRMIDQWMLDHGHKRPAHDVEPKQRRRSVFAEIADDYERAMRERGKSA